MISEKFQFEIGDIILTFPLINILSFIMKSSAKTLFFLFLTIFCSQGYAQRECGIWYFGDFHGIDLNHDSVQVLTNGGMFTASASATISDKYGNLLFYTNGQTVWNAQHDTMPNGHNLNGDPLSFHCMIIPHPGNNMKYFIFTHDFFNAPLVHGLQYSVVNMELDNGLGDVTGRNISLGVWSFEEMIAVRHCNKRDFWLIVHSQTYFYSPDEYYSFLITPEGVDPNPVVTPTIPTSYWGSSFDYTTNTLYCKPFAPSHLVCRFLFSPETGNMQFVDTLTLTTKAFRKTQTSPDGSRLYLLEGHSLFQYDLTLISEQAIAASRTLVHPNNHVFLDFTLAQNGKIYLTKLNHNFLFSVEDPNELGLNSNFNSDSIDLILPQVSSRMLPPSYISGYQFSSSFEWDHVCLGDTTQFTYLIQACGSPPTATNLFWDFGDPASGAANTSNVFSPVHYYSQVGNYTIRLISVSSISTDTVYKTIPIVENPIPNLGTDIDSLQPGSQISLDAGQAFWEYAWSSGQDEQTINVSQSGQYSVTVIDRYGCQGSDVINVNYISIDEFESPGKIQLFPNPAKNILRIYSDFTISKIELFNSYGQQIQVRQNTGSDRQLDISGLASGKYFIKALINGKSVVKEFIVQH